MKLNSPPFLIVAAISAMIITGCIPTLHPVYTEGDLVSVSYTHLTLPTIYSV